MTGKTRRPQVLVAALLVVVSAFVNALQSIAQLLREGFFAGGRDFVLRPVRLSAARATSSACTTDGISLAGTVGSKLYPAHFVNTGFGNPNVGNVGTIVNGNKAGPR